MWSVINGIMIWVPEGAMSGTDALLAVALGLLCIFAILGAFLTFEYTQR